MAERRRIHIDTEQIIFATDDSPALIGFDAPENTFSIEGWKWDDRFWTTDEQENQQAILPTLYNPGAFGLPIEFFQSGIGHGNDLNINRILDITIDGEQIWAAEVNHGEFFNRKVRRYLYADDSIIQYIDSADNEAGRNTVQLNYKLKETIPISIETYLRTIETDNFIVYNTIHPKLEFTGKLDIDGNPLPTFENGQILFDNVDPYKFEAVVIYDLEPEKLIFNGDYIETIGQPMDLTDISTTAESFAKRDLLEKMGEVTNALPGIIFRTRHFPIIRDDDLHLYLVDENTGDVEEWTKVDNFNNSNSTDTHFIVDRDLGLVTFGDNTHGAIPTQFRAVYITYKLTYKVEYEADNTKDFIIAKDINLNPTINSTSQGFIFLTEKRVNIGSILLTTNEPFIIGSTNSYGPITLGNDFGKLVATVLDTFNQPLPDLKVTFKIENVPAVGKLNGLGDTITVTTNRQGQAIAFYNPPSLIDDLGTFAVSLTNSNKTLILDDDQANLTDPSQLFMFQVRKDDPIFGVVGADTTIGEVPYDISFNPLVIKGRKVIVYTFDPLALHPRTGLPGAFFPLQPTTIDSGFRLNFLEPLWAPDPSINDDENPVAGYWVVSKKQVRITASVFSRFLGRTIRSNELSFVVSLPDYLLGVFVDTNGDRIPYGFRIKDNQLDAASALGGATFLTINDAYMDNPLSHTFNVTI